MCIGQPKMIKSWFTKSIPVVYHYTLSMAFFSIVLMYYASMRCPFWFLSFEGFFLLFAIDHFESTAQFFLASVMNTFFYCPFGPTPASLAERNNSGFFMVVDYLLPDNIQVSLTIFWSQLLDCWLDSLETALVFFSIYNSFLQP